MSRDRVPASLSEVPSGRKAGHGGREETGSIDNLGLSLRKCSGTRRSRARPSGHSEAPPGGSRRRGHLPALASVAAGASHEEIS